MGDLIVDTLRVEREGRVILDGCSAEFRSGQRTVLWGRSGAGKSTLLSAIAGLLRPQSGSIRLGHEVFFSSAGVDLPPHRRRIGFVFQDLALWPHLEAIDQITLAGGAARMSREDARRLLASVGLTGLERRRPAQLSGGEQQRLAIGRALAGKPSLLLLDEPFSSLDQDRKESLYELLRRVSPLVDGPTIYVTHHRDDAASLAEDVVTLDGGNLTRGGQPW